MTIRAQEKKIYDSADVAVIGAGSVGLWTAAQIKIRNPNANVVVFEQHHKHQRKHLLIINPSSLKGTPNHPELNAFINTVKKTNHLSTTVIENSLQKLAENVGVNVLYKKIENPTDIIKELPNIKLLIGADGAHSLTRRTIFEGKEKERKTLAYVAEIKYTVDGKAKSQPHIAHKVLKSIAGGYIKEHVGSQNKEGDSPVTLRLLISEKEFKALRSSGKATFAKPLDLNSDSATIPERVSNLAKRWLSTKKELFKEKAVDVKLTTTNLDCYVSENIVTKKENVHVVLVGDANFGVPLFRSLNNGLLCGTKLAEEVAPKLQNNTLEAPLKAYEKYVRKLSSREVFYAKIKVYILRFFSAITHYSSKILPERLKIRFLSFYIKIHNQTESITESVMKKIPLSKSSKAF